MNRILGRVFDWLRPLTRRLLGPEMNRPTEQNVAAAGLEIVPRPTISSTGVPHP